MITLKLRSNRSGPAAGFHPWIFTGAFAALPKNLNPGDPVRIESDKGEFLACGYFNEGSNIAVKIWGVDPDEEVDAFFFLKRIANACEFRQKYVQNSMTDSYRLIHGESDWLPGFTADKYADYLCVQFHTRAMERWRSEIIRALIKTLSPKGIYECSDSHTRLRDGLSPISGILYGDVPDLVHIRENVLKFIVDVKQGQKTGFFLDQRDKRQAVLKYAPNAHVLNCFCYTGSFSVYAQKAGATSIVNVDSSDKALSLARENARLNKLDTAKCEYICTDAKNYLKHTVEEKQQFNLVILDPPAFIKEKTRKRDGISGYKFINEKGMALLTERGILLTCSCSSFLSTQDFRYLLSECGARARKPFTVVEEYFHGIDHPALLPFTEGQYLKCMILKAMI